MNSPITMTRSIMPIFLIAVLALSLMPAAQAGTFELVPNTTPTPVEINGKRYVIIKKDGSVSFKVAQPEGLQSIKWKFSNGSPGDRTGVGPHDIKYDKEAGWGAINPVQIEVKRKVGDQNCNTPFKRVAAVVVPVVEPDAGQAGTNGDMVPSNKGATGEKHYVSPKKAGEFVTFKAKFGSEFAFGDALEWEGGEEVTGSPDKRKVSRGTTGKTVLKIKRKNDGVEVARLNVWIVWGTGTIVQTPTQIFSRSNNIQLADGTTGNRAQIIAGATIYDRFGFKFTIEPDSLFQWNEDVPDLKGVKKADPPGGTYIFDSSRHLKNGAHTKWDISRQLKIRIKNQGVPANKWPAASVYYPDAMGLLSNQPLADEVVLNFPSNEVEGNDDSLPETSATNPYEAFSEAGSISHGVAELSSSDRPGSSISDYGLGDGDVFEELNFFREFMRLNIGSQWYRISDYLDWHFHLRVKYSNDRLENDGSSQGAGH